MAIIAIITSNKLDFLGSSSIYHPVTNGRRNQIPITESISKTQRTQRGFIIIKKPVLAAQYYIISVKWFFSR